MEGLSGFFGFLLDLIRGDVKLAHFHAQTFDFRVFQLVHFLIEKIHVFAQFASFLLCNQFGPIQILKFIVPLTDQIGHMS